MIQEALIAAVAAFAVAGLNAAGVCWTLNRGFGRRVQNLAKLFVGSMILRFVLVGALSAMLFLFTAIHRELYAGALILFLVVFQVGEILWILRRARAAEAHPGREGASP